MNKRGIGDLLLDNGQITPEQLKQAQAERETTGESISKALFRLGWANENHIKNALELEYGVNYLPLRKLVPDPTTLALLPESLIREYEAVPVNKEGTRLTLAMVRPSDGTALDELKGRLSAWQIKPNVCSEDDFFDFISRTFPPPLIKEAASAPAPVSQGGREEISPKSPDMLIPIQMGEVDKSPFEAAADAAVMMLSQHIVSNAIAKGCTNIHIEPTEKEALVHYRKEGVLLPPRKLPLALLPELLNTYKSMTSIKQTANRLPIDGRLRVELEGKEPTFLRLSIVPGAHGEHLILWLD